MHHRKQTALLSTGFECRSLWRAAIGGEPREAGSRPDERKRIGVVTKSRRMHHRKQTALLSTGLRNNSSSRSHPNLPVVLQIRHPFCVGGSSQEEPFNSRTDTKYFSPLSNPNEIVYRQKNRRNENGNGKTKNQHQNRFNQLGDVINGVIRL